MENYTQTTEPQKPSKKVFISIILTGIALIVALVVALFIGSEKEDAPSIEDVMPQAQSSTGGAPLGDVKTELLPENSVTSAPPSAEPSTPPEFPLRNNWADFPKGTCVNGIGLNQVSMKLAEVPCETAHDGVVLGVHHYDSPDAYPEASFLDSEYWNDALCNSGWTVREGWTTSTFFPTREQWEAGERGIVCFEHQTGNLTPVFEVTGEMNEQWNRDFDALLAENEDAPGVAPEVEGVSSYIAPTLSWDAVETGSASTAPTLPAPAEDEAKTAVGNPAPASENPVPAPAPSAKTVEASPTVSSDVAKTVVAPAETAPEVVEETVPEVVAEVQPAKPVMTYWGHCPSGIGHDKAFSAECGVGMGLGKIYPSYAPLGVPQPFVTFVFHCSDGANPMKNADDPRCEISAIYGNDGGE